VGVRRLLTGGLLMITAAAVAWALRGLDWPAAAAAARGRPPGFLAAVVGGGLATTAAALLLAMAAWRGMLIGVGAPVGVVAAARIYFVGVFARFVPGKVLGFVTSVHMGRSIGIAAGRIVSAWLLALAVLVQTGMTIGLLAAPAALGGSAGWLAVAVLPLAVTMVRPDLVNVAAGRAARLLRRPVPGRVSGRQVRRATTAQSLSWLLAGVHLWLLAIALGAPPVASLPLCLGAFSLATVAGLAAVVIPEGIGVREVVLMAALSTVLPLPEATVAVLASRLIFTLGEVVTAGVGLLAAEVARRRAAGRRTPEENPREPEPVARHAMG
jgi:hypothetical protein